MSTAIHPHINPVDILGVQYDNLLRSEVLDCIEVWISQKQAHQICTPNVAHLLLARKDPEFQSILERADLVVADGMGVVCAGRFLGTPLKENVGGRLLLPEFAARAVQKGYRIFLLGGKNCDVTQKASACLCADYPGLCIAGTYTPPFMHEFDDVENQRMVDVVNQSKSDVLFVCLGTPKQEKWIARNLQKLNVPVSIGVGAALDMIAGEVYEPPRWISGIGFEWLVKLIQEPKRLWRRYLVGVPLFLGLVLLQRLRLIGASSK